MKWKEQRCYYCEGNFPPGTATRWHSSDLIETCEWCGGEMKIWVLGEPNLGCGVHMGSNGWEGDMVIFNKCYKLPARPTLEEAITNAEDRFGKLYEQYHEEND